MSVHAALCGIIGVGLLAYRYFLKPKFAEAVRRVAREEILTNARLTKGSTDSDSRFISRKP